MGLWLDPPSFCVTYETLIRNQLPVCPVAHVCHLMRCKHINMVNYTELPHSKKSHSTSKFTG